MLLLLLACKGTPTPVDTDVPTPAETGAPDTGSPDTGGGSLDCTALPAAPPSTRLTGPPASEDFAFDDAGHLISHQGTFLVKSTYPPGEVVPWVATLGGAGGPASMRMLPTGDLVYHDVDTGTLYRVEPSGATVAVFSGFGYAGGIEVHPNGLVYVVDIIGLHTFDPYTTAHDLTHGNAGWTSPNGITLSTDRSTLLVSARNGIWAVPVDAAGAPAGAATLFSAAPQGVSELLGMGADACGNVYVVGSVLPTGSRLWRLGADGSGVETLLTDSEAWFSNLQWGSGIGGWADDVLYVVDRRIESGGYQAVEVGVPGKDRSP